MIIDWVEIYVIIHVLNLIFRIHIFIFNLYFVENVSLTSLAILFVFTTVSISTITFLYREDTASFLIFWLYDYLLANTSVKWSFLHIFPTLIIPVATDHLTARHPMDIRVLSIEWDLCWWKWYTQYFPTYLPYFLHVNDQQIM